MKKIAQKNSNYKIGRIIIVDDEAELMSALCEMLAGQGYETAGFLMGAEALAVLKEREFDLLLTDLMMPGMDGIELIRAGLDIDPNLIGIIMTGHGTVQTAVEAMKTGAFDYMLKPFKLNTLLPLLSRAMQVRNLRLENMQLKETVAIHELGKAIAFSSDLNSILNKIADAALQQCSADEVSIMLPTKGGRELYVAVVRGGHTENLGEHAPIEQGIAGWVARNRESIVFRGEVSDPRMAPIRPRNDIHTAVSMPMLSQSKLVGVLNVNITKSHRQFTLGQLKALSILVSIISPILENTALYIQIRKAEEEYRSIFENAREGIFRSLPGERFITANPALVRIFGYDSLEDILVSVTDITRQIYVNPDDAAEFARIMEIQGDVINFECQVYRKNGSRIWILVSAHAVRNQKGRLLYHEGTIEDVTERKSSELCLKLAKEILETLNRPNDIQKLINDILHLLKESTGIEAVGIRLREGEDYPYYVTNGFSDHFLKAENYLCARDAAGEIIHDSDGNPQLECMCGNIICGRTNPALPLFTEGGSFWTNSTTKLLTSTSEEDLLARMRNRCNSAGYESVALIPLRSRNEIIGLLQLNDMRPDRFTKEMTQFFEGIGESIGIAVNRQLSAASIALAEERYRSIFDNAQEGIFRLTPEGRMIMANKAQAVIFGYESPDEFVSSITDAAHQLYVSPTDYAIMIEEIEKHGFVKEKEVQFKRKNGSIIWVSLNMHVVRDEKRQILYYEGNNEDITDRKQGVEKLRKSLKATVQAISATVETRDPYTAGHQRRVSALARAIATEMNFSRDQIDGLRMAAVIHDIGKISVPTEILSMPRKLTNIEFNLVKTHAQSGYDIIKGIEFPWPVADIILQHHERMDGSGYPNGLKGEDIFMEARILAVADVVESMASYRPYRPALGLATALDEIAKNRGILYDPIVADTCLRLFNEKGYNIE